MENGTIDVEAAAVRECDTSGWVQSEICQYKRKRITTKHYNKKPTRYGCSSEDNSLQQEQLNKAGIRP